MYEVMDFAIFLQCSQKNKFPGGNLLFYLDCINMSIFKLFLISTQPAQLVENWGQTDDILFNYYVFTL